MWTGEGKRKKIERKRWGGVYLREAGEGGNAEYHHRGGAQIEAGCAANEIAARLADRFGGPPDSIEREVTSLIGDLQQKGLLEESASV